MKRERVDLADVACRDNLALACWKAAQGKRQRPMLNVAEARFERALVNSSFACRPGKGVHAAVAAVQRGLQRWPWVVQVDVAGYFGSIQHRLLMQQLGRLFKDDAFLNLWARVLAAGSEWAGAAPADLQRAQASQAAALLPAQSLHFQQSLWWPQASV